MRDFAFSDLISPVERARFLSEYWELKPLLVTRNDPEFFDSILTRDDLEFLLSSASTLDAKSIDVLVNETTLSYMACEDRVTVLFDAFKKGSTIRVRGVQRCWKPIWELCREIEQDFNFPVSANLYCTPPNTNGLNRHFDDHDVLILQISGEKHWQLFEPATKLPLRFERPSEVSAVRGTRFRKAGSSADLESATPLCEVTLKACDLLYLPRGFPHQASTIGDASVHLTFGLHVITWLDLITVAVGLMGIQNQELREALPLGFASLDSSANKMAEKFAALLEAIPRDGDFNSALEELAGSFLWSRQSLGAGTFTDPDRSEEVTITSQVERPTALLLRLDIRDESIGLVSENSIVESLWLPRVFDVPMRFIFEHTTFRVDELAGGLTEKARVNLVRQLVHNRILRIRS